MFLMTHVHTTLHVQQHHCTEQLYEDTSCRSQRHSFPNTLPSQRTPVHDSKQIEIPSQTNPFMIEIQSKLQDELGYLFEDREPMGFYSTSIYDHTLVQGMSRVVQRLLPQLRPVEELVDVLVTRSRIDKGFLFDVVSKIFVATDSNATDLSRSLANFEVRRGFLGLDVVGRDMKTATVRHVWGYYVVHVLLPTFRLYTSLLSHMMLSPDCTTNKLSPTTLLLSDMTTSCIFSLPLPPGYYELLSDMIDVVIDISCIYGLDDDFDEELEDGPTGLAYDDQSSCVIQLNQGQMLYLRQVNHFMAFACLLREENFDQKFLLDSNLAVFNEGLKVGSSRSRVEEEDSVTVFSRAGPLESIQSPRRPTGFFNGY